MIHDLLFHTIEIGVPAIIDIFKIFLIRKRIYLIKENNMGIELQSYQYSFTSYICKCI